MPYIGAGATALVGVIGVQGQAFNGNGSNTVFTLSRPVANNTAVEVLVNNVQQSPYDGSYAISGATLTFSEAPSSGANNVYVVFRDQPIQSSVESPAVISDRLNTSQGAFSLPSGNTGYRPAGANGYIRFNTELTRFEGYDGSSWVNMTGATGSGGDEIFNLNGNTVSTSYSIPTGKNASSVGPITLASNTTVTIPAGSRWVIL